MGGLLRRMPITGSLVLGGSLAICALPPLNGFVSEWFIYLGLLEMGQASGGAIAMLAMLLVVLLALVGGLVLITFSRLVGIALLGEPRCAATAAAHEASWLMLVPMALLMAGCLLLGLYPALALRGVAGVVALLLPGSHLNAAVGQGEPLAYLSWLVALLLAGIGGLVLLRWLRAKAVRRLPTWGCGFSLPTARMAYTAGGYAELAQRSLLCACLQPTLANVPPTGLFPRTGRLDMASHDPIFSRFFRPMFQRLADRALTCRGLQAGQLHIYVLYIFIATALLLGLVLLP
jgi:NADH:ubiquinone oxidoreductase subunit 5 (subunit L)/multisubunit Na+/H+ antiporter MnhA subunit